MEKDELRRRFIELYIKANDLLDLMDEAEQMRQKAKAISESVSGDHQPDSEQCSSCSGD